MVGGLEAWTVRCSKRKGRVVGLVGLVGSGLGCWGYLLGCSRVHNPYARPRNSLARLPTNPIRTPNSYSYSYPYALLPLLLGGYTEGKFDFYFFSDSHGTCRSHREVGRGILAELPNPANPANPAMLPPTH